MSRFGLQNGELVWARNPYREDDPVWWPVRAPPPSNTVLKYGYIYGQCAQVARMCPSTHHIYQTRICAIAVHNRNAVRVSP